MDEGKIYRIKLADGTDFYAVSDGAGNYIANEIVSDDAFSAWNLSDIEIYDGNSLVENPKNQVLRTYHTINNEKTYIRFSDMTEIEEIEADYNAKIDYIAMMTEVDV